MILLDVSDIIAAYDRLGDRLYGEAVSQREHALQCAKRAAEDGASDSLIIAALLHDIGHLAEASDVAGHPALDARHEAVGATLLKRLLGPYVTRPIALHVAAKRYLCAAESGYPIGLSEALQYSMRLQGGPFSPTEASRFIGRRHAAEAVRLRRYDDLGKVANARTGDFNLYASTIVRLAGHTR